MCIRQRIGGSNPPLTAIFEEELVRKYGLFFSPVALPRGDEKPRPGFDNWRQPVGQMASLRGICPEGERSESIPPLTAIFEEELVRKYGLFFSPVALPRGDEKPRPGFDNWRQPVGQMASLRGICPEGERSESIPPLTAIFEEELVRKYGLFFSPVALPRGDEMPRPGLPPALLFYQAA